jgi:hypothetical protein
MLFLLLQIKQEPIEMEDNGLITTIDIGETKLLDPFNIKPETKQVITVN